MLLDLANHYKNHIEELSLLLREAKSSNSVLNNSYTESGFLHRIILFGSKNFEMRFHVWINLANDELSWHNHKYPMASLCLAGGYT